MYLLVTKYNLHISVTPKNGGETDIEVSLVKKKGEKFKYQSRKQHDTGSLRSTQKKLSHWRIKERRASSKEENWYNFISSLAPHRVLVQRHRPRISQQSLERDGKKKTRKASTIGFHRAALTNYQGKAAKPLRRGNRPSLEAIGRRHRA